MKSREGSSLKLFLALATAEFKSFEIDLAAFLVVKLKIEAACSVDLPRIMSATSLTFLADILKLLNLALTIMLILNEVKNQGSCEARFLAPQAKVLAKRGS